ncbi:hypothetical protein DV515_00013945, partial [Chloebia gouldiae]
AGPGDWRSPAGERGGERAGGGRARQRGERGRGQPGSRPTRDSARPHGAGVGRHSPRGRASAVGAAALSRRTRSQWRGGDSSPRVPDSEVGLLRAAVRQNLEQPETDGLPAGDGNHSKL